MSINIQMTSPQGVTLNVKDKLVQDNVQIVPALQSKNVTPSDNAQTVTADNGYAGVGQMTVGAIPSNYAKNAKRWNVTVSTDQTAAFTLLQDSWLAEHRSDPTLIVCVVPLFKVTTRGATTFRLQGNINFGDPNEYSTSVALKPSSTGTSHWYPAYPITQGAGATAADMGITTNGTLMMRASAAGSGYMVVAGNYSVIAWLA